MISLDGEKLRSLRKARKLTQESMAEFANTTDRYLRDLESDKKSNPSAGLLYSLSRALGVSMEELMRPSKDDR